MIRWTTALCAAIFCPLAACGGASSNDIATAITITSPTPNQTVTLTAAKTSSVAFSLTTFTLADPSAASACSGVTACGHVHLLIDGAACTPAGAPYNNDGFASPIDAKFSSCATPTGSHTVTLELHHNDHSAYNDANGHVVSANVTITAM
jgi:hypothetical protein